LTEILCSKSPLAIIFASELILSILSTISLTMVKPNRAKITEEASRKVIEILLLLKKKP